MNSRKYSLLMIALAVVMFSCNNGKIKQLEEENNALVFDLREHGDNIDTNTNIYREGEELEELLLKRIDNMQDHIQKHSQKVVEEK